MITRPDRVLVRPTVLVAEEDELPRALLVNLVSGDVLVDRGVRASRIQAGA